MRITTTGISCGIRRLIIGPTEKPKQDKLAALLDKTFCAIMMTSVPTKRKDLIELLIANGFKQVEKPIAANRTKHSFLVRHNKPEKVKELRQRRHNYYW